MEMFDASDDVYEYLMCSICPVKLDKASLCYNAEKNNIEDRERSWIVQAPDAGFLFPAFNDRNTDLHSMLYYTRNPEVLQPALMEEVFGLSDTVVCQRTERDLSGTGHGNSRKCL